MESLYLDYPCPILGTFGIKNRAVVRIQYSIGSARWEEWREDTDPAFRHDQRGIRIYHDDTTNTTSMQGLIPAS